MSTAMCSEALLNHPMNIDFNQAEFEGVINAACRRCRAGLSSV